MVIVHAKATRVRTLTGKACITPDTCKSSVIPIVFLAKQYHCTPSLHDHSNDAIDSVILNAEVLPESWVTHEGVHLLKVDISALHLT